MLDRSTVETIFRNSRDRMLGQCRTKRERETCREVFRNLEATAIQFAEVSVATERHKRAPAVRTDIVRQMALDAGLSDEEAEAVVREASMIATGRNRRRRAE